MRSLYTLLQEDTLGSCLASSCDCRYFRETHTSHGIYRHSFYTVCQFTNENMELGCGVLLLNSENNCMFVSMRLNSPCHFIQDFRTLYLRSSQRLALGDLTLHLLTPPLIEFYTMMAGNHPLSACICIF